MTSNISHTSATLVLIWASYFTKLTFEIPKTHIVYILCIIILIIIQIYAPTGTARKKIEDMLTCWASKTEQGRHQYMK